MGHPFSCYFLEVLNSATRSHMNCFKVGGTFADFVTCVDIGHVAKNTISTFRDSTAADVTNLRNSGLYSSS